VEGVERRAEQVEWTRRNEWRRKHRAREKRVEEGAHEEKRVEEEAPRS
jgi:hypothetical protein